MQIEDEPEIHIPNNTKITQQNSNIQLINQILMNIKNPDFNIFELDELAEKNTLKYMAYNIFSDLGYFDKNLIKEEKFRNFIHVLTEGYNRDVPYHNDLHAGDVFQTCYVMIHKRDFVKIMNISDIDILALLLAAVSHDFKHPGKNNLFQINAKTSIAITYNDSSVLENYHISEIFKEINKEENFVLNVLAPEEYRIIRRRMIECVLSTDMANHAKTVSNVKNKLETFDVNRGKNLEKMIFLDNLGKTYENQQTILNLIIHTADISNPCKPASVNKIWVDLLFIEFFSQGDEERNLGLPISHLCDRYKTDINQSQIFFINYIVMPTFETLLRVIPEVDSYYKTMTDNLNRYSKIVNG